MAKRFRARKSKQQARVERTYKVSASPPSERVQDWAAQSRRGWFPDAPGLSLFDRVWLSDLSEREGNVFVDLENEQHRRDYSPHRVRSYADAVRSVVGGDSPIKLWQRMPTEARVVIVPPSHPLAKLSAERIPLEDLKASEHLDPREVIVCVRRNVRREVLFAMDLRVKAGGAGRKDGLRRMSDNSTVKC